MRKTIAVLMLVMLLTACGGSPTPGAATPAPGATRPGSVTTAPAAAPTLALTPPGIPAGGFPLLTTALDGTIVYNNGDGDIYQVQPRPGATPQRLIAAADNKGFLQEPIWSPDGKRIAYTYLLPFDTTGLPAQDILVANADGSSPQTMVAHQVAGEVFTWPVFSPDSRLIYYAHSNPIFKNKQITGVTLTLEQYDTQTKKTMTIATDGTQPDVSPDGKRLVYVKIDPDTFQMDLMIVGVDGKNAQQVVPGTSMGGGINGPRWSRDGKQILFGAPNFFASLNTPPTRAAASHTGDPFNQALGWVASWFTVGVAEAHGPPWDLWLVDADGQNLKRLTQIGEDDPSPSWSPDGKNIAFVGLAGFYITNADGANVHWLHHEGGRGRVDWKK